MRSITEDQRAALSVLDDEITRLRAEIAQLAMEGDILACDIRHGWIEAIQLTQAIIDDSVAL